MAVYGNKRLTAVPLNFLPGVAKTSLVAEEPQTTPCTTKGWEMQQLIADALLGKADENPSITLPEVQIRKYFSSAWLLALGMGISEENLHEILRECMTCAP